MVLWDIAGARPLLRMEHSAGPGGWLGPRPAGLAFSPDGRRLIAAGREWLPAAPARPLPLSRRCTHF